MRTEAERLSDILESIRQIRAKIPNGSEASVATNELLLVWAVYYLIRIGEAVAALGSETRQSNPAVPWSRIAGMRNVLVHEYFRVDPQIVVDILANDLDNLGNDVQSIVNSSSGSE